MEELVRDQCCLSCLCGNDENTLQSYYLENDNLKSLFQVDSLCICYLCKQIVKRLEIFVKNVQRNWILLENFQNILDSSLDSIRLQTQPLIKLTKVSPLNITEYNSLDASAEETFVTVDNCCELQQLSKDVQIKLELELKEEGSETIDDLPKEEDEENIAHSDGEFAQDDEFHESFVKDENEVPTKVVMKQELDIEQDDIELSSLKETAKRSKVKKKDKTVVKKVPNKQTNLEKQPELPKIRKVYITKTECRRERAAKLEDEKYTNCTYKCADCVKGYMFKDSYGKHMELHSEENGDYVCDICKQRFLTDGKLQIHKRNHIIRYTCTVCDFTRSDKQYIYDHYWSVHCPGNIQYKCPHCPKEFKRKSCLRKHCHYSHFNKERAVCGYCDKTYVNKQVLKSHIMMQHAKIVGAVAVANKHVCQECGAGFKAPSHLKKHSIKHSHKREYYCVECDKSFKSESILQQHLKTASPHVSYLELPLQCGQCGKRFPVKRNLERHINSVHLKLKPFQCDKCDKAYVDSGTLYKHKRIVHEGYKRPLAFPCTFCDKIFDRKEILKSHLRTHTGERPYQCSKCPAQFSQASVLGTHVKLVHLKLMRDGTPKGEAKRRGATKKRKKNEA